MKKKIKKSRVTDKYLMEILSLALSNVAFDGARSAKQIKLYDVLKAQGLSDVKIREIAVMLVAKGWIWPIDGSSDIYEVSNKFYEDKELFQDKGESKERQKRESILSLLRKARRKIDEERSKYFMKKHLIESESLSARSVKEWSELLSKISSYDLALISLTKAIGIIEKIK